MTLLDQLNANEELNMVNCCNELEAGYAADGYARAKGESTLMTSCGHLTQSRCQRYRLLVQALAVLW